MSTHSRVGRVLHRIFDFEVTVAAIALVAMMFTVVADVFMRFVFNDPIRGSFDLVGILLVIMVSFGIPKVIADRGEIVIDLIDEFVPNALSRGLRIIAGLLGAAVLGFIIWSMIGPAVSAYTYGDRSLELNLPTWIIWAIALVGLAGATVASILVMIAPGVGGEHTGPIAGSAEGIE